MVDIVTALSQLNNPSEHPPPRDKGGTCTCSRYNAHLTDLRDWRPDPNCPRHGLNAPQLDIDTSYTTREGT